MGWVNPEVQKEHFSLIAWIWHELVPEMHGPACGGEVTKEMAAEVYAMYRADPKTQHPHVSQLKRWTNELWMLYSQAN